MFKNECLITLFRAFAEKLDLSCRYSEFPLQFFRNPQTRYIYPRWKRYCKQPSTKQNFLSWTFHITMKIRLQNYDFVFFKKDSNLDAMYSERQQAYSMLPFFLLPINRILMGFIIYKDFHHEQSLIGLSKRKCYSFKPPSSSTIRMCNII